MWETVILSNTRIRKGKEDTGWEATVIIQARENGSLDQVGSSGSGEKQVKLERFIGRPGRGKMRDRVAFWLLKLSSGIVMLISLLLTRDMATLTLRWWGNAIMLCAPQEDKENVCDCYVCCRDTGVRGHLRQHSSSWLLLPLEIKPQLPTVASY